MLTPGHGAAATSREPLALPLLLDRLQQALLDGGEAVPQGLEGRLLAGPVPGFGIEERLGIYRHAYRARLVEALRETYGHCAEYLDGQFDGKGDDSAFDKLAAAFVETHPSLARNINAYGQDWPQWLAEHLGQWPEVADLAQIDWHLRRAFDGADAPALDLAGLTAQLAAHDGATLPLRPVPTLRRLQVTTNALALWLAIDQDTAPPAAEVLAEPVEVIVWRVGESPHFRSIDRFESLAIDALLAHCDFGQMCERLAADAGDGESDEEEEKQEAALSARAGALLRRWIDEALLAA